jgi:AhpC/TSA family
LKSRRPLLKTHWNCQDFVPLAGTAVGVATGFGAKCRALFHNLIGDRMSYTVPIRSITLGATFVLLVATTSWSQVKEKPAPEEHTGVKVGEKAPAFTLKDQEGKERSLEELLKKGKVALVFYRSADW